MLCVGAGDSDDDNVIVMREGAVSELPDVDGTVETVGLRVLSTSAETEPTFDDCA